MDLDFLRRYAVHFGWNISSVVEWRVFGINGYAGINRCKTDCIYYYVCT